MIKPIQHDDRFPVKGVKHAFFTREGGVSEGPFASLNASLTGADRKESVLENRRRIANFMNVSDDHLCICQQVHSPDVVSVTAPWDEGHKPKADGMVACVKGLALGILTADCVPVLFADEQAGVVGAAHAGWRGAVDGVLENTIAQMERLGADRKGIVAAIGPCIWQESYEVDSGFVDRLFLLSAENKTFVKNAPRDGHFLFDLPGFVASKLKQAGLKDVIASPFDTLANENMFFSHRRGTLRGIPEEGRMLACIVLT